MSDMRGNIQGSLHVNDGGALNRIANACEQMAKRYDQLIADREWYKRRFQDEQEENIHLCRRVCALQGVITRMKNQRMKKEKANV